MVKIMVRSSYFVDDGTEPTLRKDPYSWDDWMSAIPLGETPDGENLARIEYCDEKTGQYVSKFDDTSFVGDVVFIGWQFKELRDGFVSMRPGSLMVVCRDAIGSFGRGGVVIVINPKKH